MKKYGLLFLCLLALPVSAKTVNSRYTPVKNPDPQYFLTITGHVVGKSKGNFTLSAVYSTFNPDCNEVVNRFEGVSAVRVRRIQYSMDLSKPHFFIKIPLQYFLPGFCQWRLTNINQKRRGQEISTVFAVREIENIGDSHIIMKYNKNYGWFSQSSSSEVKNNKNYYFHMIFYPIEKRK